ncbi:MAG: nitrogenase [Firmicutes bacterium]|nr:nitrogenase [Bacillota bacterium]
MERQTGFARNATENPCNMCMPMGGIIPFKGVEKAMVIMHGSQGCATYMRRHMAEHFNEPIDVASSSLNEKGTIYGGEKNLKRGLDNLIKLYNPGVIGILTTCLAETIGEDIDRIASEYLLDRGLNDVSLVTVPVPGYGGSHSEGYWMAARNIIAKLGREAPANRRINVIVPNISPADIREIKRILQLMCIEYTIFPDFSDTLDSPFTTPYKKIPSGGTRIREIAEMSGAVATIQMGVTASKEISPGHYLQDTYGVPLYNIPIPIGLENTDKFFAILKQVTGKDVPESIFSERGRLLDGMVDSHKYNAAGRSAIFGDPELVLAIAGVCRENGITPVVVATGSKSSMVAEVMKSSAAVDVPEQSLLPGTDFARIREQCREKSVNIAIGHSDGRHLTEKEGIPLVRVGFPIHDRMGGQRLLSVGYTGTMTFLDRITNTLLEEKHKNYRHGIFDKFYTSKMA